MSGFHVLLRHSATRILGSIIPYSVILGTTIFFSVLFISALLIQDILYGIIDPRIRVAGAKE